MWSVASRAALLVFAPLIKVVRRQPPPRGGVVAMSTRMRAAVASDDRSVVSRWLSTRKVAVIDARHPLNGETALMIAASRGLLDMVSLLLSATPPPDINMKTANPIDGRHFSAVMAAAAGGHEACVSLLLDAGASMEGVRYILDTAHSDGFISDEQHMKLRHCCKCCTANCTCCVDECGCCG
jgi:hypothetical protein